MLCFENSRIKGKDLASKVDISPPVVSAAVCSKEVVPLLIHCLLLLPLS